jgi:adenosylmethionine-8-amino-7-oxononanoate aminotransferase
MAMGVTASSKKIHDAFLSDDKLKTFFHGHSFTANPLACTAALASLDLLLKKSCLDNIERINQQHQDFIAQLQTTNHKPQTINNGPASRLQTKNHRCVGTIAAFEVETGRDEYLNDISATITRRALSKGVFIRPLGNTVYIMPPYCITEPELQKIYDVITEILDES